MSNSRKSPCWQQREIAAQNAWIDAATGKEKDPVYRAPCDLTQPEKKPVVTDTALPNKTS